MNPYTVNVPLDDFKQLENDRANLKKIKDICKDFEIHYSAYSGAYASGEHSELSIALAKIKRVCE